MARKRRRKSGKSKSRKSRTKTKRARKASKRRIGRVARKGKGRIPLEILEKRARKLTKLVRSRGGKV